MLTLWQYDAKVIAPFCCFGYIGRVAVTRCFKPSFLNLEYANSVWSPHRKSDIEQIEKFQKSATKLVVSLRNLPCKECLMRLNLHTLKYRRLRGDMIEVFKIIHHKYDNTVAPSLFHNSKSVTKGNKFKLQNQTFNHNFRKYFFTARIVNIWNTLHNYVVDVLYVDLFKLRLDKFWILQDIMFDVDCRLNRNRDQSI